MFKKILKRIYDVAVNCKPFSMDEAIRAGMQAEYNTRKMINKKIKGSGWMFYNSVRIPDKIECKRREIDFIIVSNNDVKVIELKNWSGSIEISNGDFIQHRRYDNDKINHGNILKDLDDKCAVLDKYLEKKMNFKEEINRYLVFYNSGLSIPNELLSNKNVIRFDQLEQYLPDNNLTEESVLVAILKLFGFKKEKTKDVVAIPERILKLKNALDGLDTWDMIELFGGKKIIGDILTEGNKRLTIYDKNITNRSSIFSIEFDIDRNIIAALYRDQKNYITITYRDGRVEKSRLDINRTLYYQGAGSTVIDEIRLKHLKRLEFGYLKKPDLRPNWSDLKLNAVHEGKVIRIEKYGVFIDIGAPKWGLLHWSKLNKGVNPEHFNIDDKLNTKILYISEKENKLTLGIV